MRRPPWRIGLLRRDPGVQHGALRQKLVGSARGREGETAICITFLIISSDKRPSRAAQPSPAHPVVSTSGSEHIKWKGAKYVSGKSGWSLSQLWVYPSGWMRSIRAVDEMYPSGWMKSIRVMDEMYPSGWMRSIRVVDEIYPSGWMRSIRASAWSHPSYGWDISDPSGWMRSIRRLDEIYPSGG